MKNVFHKIYKDQKPNISSFVTNFATSGEQFGKIGRNSIRVFDLNGRKVNIKSFKVPNIFNQIAYKFFRKSKAQRSFEYASKLEELGIGTPSPIAYFEDPTPFLFKRSYYVSEHLECDLTYRELLHDFNYPGYEDILRAFTRFTFDFHEKGVNFLDHSPGNTLIKKVGDSYNFYLVDLNRMSFETVSFTSRMKNFSRLTEEQSMIEIMSDEYAKVANLDYDVVLKGMTHEIHAFRSKIQRKKAFKKRLRG